MLLGIHPLIGQSIKGDLPVSLKFQNAPLNEVLDHLSEQYDIAFAYNAASLREVLVDIKAKKKPLQEVLAELLAGRGFDFKLQDNGVLISPSADGLPGVRILDWSGMVKDSVSGEALPFASLFIPGLNRGTTTNADGYFLIQEVP
ncbi:MAG: secretin and TonB N-terminal domain-containing protein, partial [Cyclobacteriaceae bacterium]|nr:secretin and TonB N-terminal domain-containing protein [Cyclobacteriaceae bacterium]